MILTDCTVLRLYRTLQLRKPQTGKTVQTGFEFSVYDKLPKAVHCLESASSVYRSLHHSLVVLICVKYRVVILVFADLEYPSVDNSYDKLSVDSGGRSFSVDTQPPKSVSYGNIPHYSRTASTVSSPLNLSHIYNK